MDLEECKRMGFIRPTKPNKELASSLIEMSAIKENVVKDAKIDEINISAFVPMAYDSLREILEALCIMHGYKVVSHACIDKLLQSLYPETSSQDFDRFRYIRNSINYYGEKVEFNQGREIISKIFVLKEQFLEVLNKLLLETS